MGEIQSRAPLDRFARTDPSVAACPTGVAVDLPVEVEVTQETNHRPGELLRFVLHRRHTGIQGDATGKACDSAIPVDGSKRWVLSHATEVATA